MYCDDYVFISDYNTDSVVTDAFQKSAKKEEIADFSETTAYKGNSNPAVGDKKENLLQESQVYQPPLNSTNDKPTDFEYRYKIYPNPSSGKFFITFNKELNLQEIVIYNSMNVIIKKITDFSYSSILVDISKEPKGNYILKLVAKDKVITENIILY